MRPKRAFDEEESKVPPSWVHQFQPSVGCLPPYPQPMGSFSGSSSAVPVAGPSSRLPEVNRGQFVSSAGANVNCASPEPRRTRTRMTAVSGARSYSRKGAKTTTAQPRETKKAKTAVAAGSPEGGLGTRFLCPSNGCPKTFSHKPDVNRHLKASCKYKTAPPSEATSSGAVCPHCFLTLSRKDALRRHLQEGSCRQKPR